MPNIRAAVKSLRQTKKRTARNTKIKAGVEIALRQARKAIASKNSEAKKLVTQAIKLLDRSVQKNVLKRNTAARLKSRLMMALNKIGKK